MPLTLNQETGKISVHLVELRLGMAGHLVPASRETTSKKDATSSRVWLVRSQETRSPARQYPGTRSSSLMLLLLFPCKLLQRTHKANLSSGP